MELEIVALFMLAVVWGTVPAAGLALLAVGLRGRVIDRRPRCRSCEYLLVGFQSRPARCPECGAALSSPGRVVLGRRAPFPARSLLGAAMILAGACPLLVVALRPAAVNTLAAVAGSAPPPAVVPRPAAAARPARRDPALAMTSRLALEPATIVAPSPFNVHALFGSAEAPGLISAAETRPGALAGRRSGPAGSGSGVSSGAATPSGPPLTTASRRLETGPLTERRVGGVALLARVDSWRVEERRIRPWRHPLNSAAPGR